MIRIHIDGREVTRAMHRLREAGTDMRLALDYGSSPQAGGTRQRGQSGATTVRFIPTGVGNAVVVQSGHLLLVVHPHGRGERAWP